MTSPSKAKGDAAEREVQEDLRIRLRLPRIRRALGAGRQDDVGDIDGVPDTVIQVADWTDKIRAIRTKTVEVEQQRKNKRVPFAASFIRLKGGTWVVVMTPEQWTRQWKFAQKGLAVHRAERSTKMNSRATKRGRSTRSSTSSKT